MHRSYLSTIVLIIAVVNVCGCEGPISSSDQQHARMDAAKNAPRAHLTYMVDNAAMQDMSLADFHFVAHTSELSGTGIERLDRLAAILIAYGGVVRYETYLTNDELIGQRMDHAREYLAMAGCDMEVSGVKPMMSGGRGMAADEAVGIRDARFGDGDEESGGGGLLILAPSGK